MRLPSWLHFRVRRPVVTALVGAALLGFVTANLGLPLVVPVFEIASLDASGALKDKSTPFPCQNRPCGCMSAEACMRSCCCFTAGERLAWFRAHNVTPLSELISAAAAEGHDHKQVNCQHCAKDEQKAAPRSCCTDKGTTNATCTTPTKTTNTQKSPAAAADVAPAATSVSDIVPQADSVSEATHDVPAEQTRKGWRVVMVIGSFAAQCQGMGPWSVTGFVAIPPIAAAAYAFDWTTAEAVACDTPALLSAIHSPPTRPPCC